ncbi:MAG: hypothetical protein HQL38_10315 [Alphaproteobacteria bacterium]|nr:hypothetical protein [Alphaproteobacteria bacterium]
MNEITKPGLGAGAEIDRLLSYIAGIQGELLQQLNEGGFVDDFVKGTEGAFMHLAFGAEAVVIPVGIFHHLATELSVKAGFEGIKRKLEDDPRMSRFSVARIRNSELAESFRLLFSEVYEKLLDKITDIENANPAPYGDRLVLDIESWLLSAMVDLDDVYFLRPQVIDKSIAREQVEHHKNFVRELSARLETLLQVQTYNFPDGRNRRGWYASIPVMKAFRDYLDGQGVQVARKALKSLPAAYDNGWKEVLATVLDHPNVVETTLVSTRAMIAFLSVAKGVYQNRPQSLADDAAGEVVGLIDKVEKALFRDDVFANFVLQRLASLDASGRIATEEYDATIHLFGILSFVLPRGYFCDDDEIETLRKRLHASGFTDRASAIERMIGVLDGPFGDELKKLKGEFDNETYFVASAKLEILLNEDLTPRSYGAAEAREEALPASERFPYILALPLMVKALAQLLFEERLRLLTASLPDDWPSIAWPDWVPKLERQCGEMADVMVKKFLKPSRMLEGAQGYAGHWRQDRDLSVTAAVCDSLSIWCGAMMMKAAVDGDYTEDRDLPAVQPSEDQQVCLRFFEMLKRYTQGAVESQGRPNLDVHATVLDWLSLVHQVTRHCFPGADPNYIQTHSAFVDVKMGFAEVVQTVALIQNLHRCYPNEDRLAITTEVVEHMNDLLGRSNGKVQPSASLRHLIRDMRQKYPNAFQWEADSEQT